MPISIKPFLMFEGCAEDAVQLYITAFEDSEIVSMIHYGANEDGAEGSVKMAEVRLGELHIDCIDSPAKHDFTFTPSSSFFTECETEEELNYLAMQLSEGGKFLMPMDDYGFSTKFAWVCDRFGVSWQLNLK